MSGAGNVTTFRIAQKPSDAWLSRRLMPKNHHKPLIGGLFVMVRMTVAIVVIAETVIP